MADTHVPTAYKYKKLGCRCEGCKLAASRYRKAYSLKNRDRINALKREAIKRRSIERKRDENLRYTHGITVDDYNRMLSSQGGVCAICKSNQWGGRWNTPCVDHNHKSGKVRGLLCLMCNRGIGNFKDNPKILETAIRYLWETER